MPYGKKSAKSAIQKSSIGRAKDEDDKMAKAFGDYFIGADNVTKLNNENFTQFIDDLDVSMVMFYDPKIKDCCYAKKHFLMASYSTFRINRGYGAVNCVTDPHICAREQVASIPMYKVYSKGRTVSTIRDYASFTAIDMMKFVDNCPVFTDTPPAPRPCDVASASASS